MKRLLLALGLLLANLGPLANSARALPGRTLEACVEIALERHPRLGAARAEVDAGRERVHQQIAPYLPQVAGGASVSRRKRSEAQATGLPGGISVSSAPCLTMRPASSAWRAG